MVQEKYDWLDILFKAIIFLTYIVFGICIWLLKKEMDKKKRKKEEEEGKKK